MTDVHLEIKVYVLIPEFRVLNMYAYILLLLSLINLAPRYLTPCPGLSLNSRNR